MKQIVNQFIDRLMRSLNSVRFILKKELVDALRDYRTIIMMIIPICVFPVVFFALNSQIKDVSNYVAKNTPIVISHSIPSNSDLIQLFYKTDDVSPYYSDDIAIEIKKGNALLGVDTVNGLLNVIYDQNSIRSTTALSHITSIVDYKRQEAVIIELDNSGGDVSVITRFSFQPIELADYSGKSSSQLMILIVPMLIVVFVFSGGSAIAIDTLCGEKERGTLESVLLSQVYRIDLLVAKMLAIFIFSFSSLILSLMGYLVAVKMNSNVASLYGVDEGFFMNAETIIIAVVISFTLCFFAVSLMAFLSLTSKSVKESQTRMTILTVVPSILGGLTMYIETSSVNCLSALLPIYNVLVLYKQLFSNNLQKTYLLLVIISNLLYAIILIGACIKQFDSEKLFAKN